jgi:hypothetical protein
VRIEEIRESLRVSKRWPQSVLVRMVYNWEGVLFSSLAPKPQLECPLWVNSGHSPVAESARHLAAPRRGGKATTACPPLHYPAG